MLEDKLLVCFDVNHFYFSSLIGMVQAAIRKIGYI
jgi:hypothetical protein